MLKLQCWMEIQEGKQPMRDKEFARELGVTAACVKRAIQAGTLFQTSNPPAVTSSTETPAPDTADTVSDDVSPIDVNQDTNQDSPSENNLENGVSDDVDPYWLQEDIHAAVAALRRLSDSADYSNTTETPQSPQQTAAAEESSGAAAVAPTETVSCCVRYLSFLLNN